MHGESDFFSTKAGCASNLLRAHCMGSLTRPMASCCRAQRIIGTLNLWDLLLPHHNLFVGEDMVTFDSIRKNMWIERIIRILVSLGAFGSISVEASWNSMHIINVSLVCGDALLIGGGFWLGMVCKNLCNRFAYLWSWCQHTLGDAWQRRQSTCLSRWSSPWPWLLQTTKPNCLLWHKDDQVRRHL